MEEIDTEIIHNSTELRELVNRKRKKRRGRNNEEEESLLEKGTENEITQPSDTNHMITPTQIVEEYVDNNNVEQLYQNNLIANTISTALGGTIMDLRHIHRVRQNNSHRQDYHSDSDSESEVEDKIRQLAEEDDVWFKGCGCRLTLDSSILCTSISMIMVIMAFCIYKLTVSSSSVW